MREVQNAEYLSPWLDLPQNEDISEYPEQGVFPPDPEPRLGKLTSFARECGIDPDAIRDAVMSDPEAVAIIIDEQESAREHRDPESMLSEILQPA